MFIPSPLAKMPKAPPPQIEGEKIDWEQAELREGDYGYHCTKKGKIVYPRPRHFFSPADLKRIERKLFQYSVNKDKDGPEPIKRLWWQTLLRKLTIEMMEEIINVLDAAIPIFDVEDVFGSAEQIYDTIWQLGTDSLNKFIDFLYKKGLDEKAKRLEAMKQARKG